MDHFPIYRADISEDQGESVEVNYIALVKEPAIESNFLKFSNKMRFKVTDNEERIITGLAMIADLPIYRRDDERGEFYVYFDAQAIKRIALRFFRNGYTKNVNLEHDSKQVPNDVFFFESMLIDRDKGKNPPPAFEDAPNGSWLISAKVDNAEVWDRVKAGDFNGFSVEGSFFLEKMDFKNHKTAEQVAEDMIQKIKNALSDFTI
jgi:hypothetical protein